MITPKGFVLLGSKSGGMRAGAHTLASCTRAQGRAQGLRVAGGSIERERTRASCCWGARAGACERGAHKSKPTCRASCSGLWRMVPCRVLHRAVVLTCVFRGVVFCGVASLSSVDLSLLLWTAAGSCTGCYTQAWCTHTHKLGTHTHKLGTHTHKLAKKRHQITGITRARENQHTEASCCHMSESWQALIDKLRRTRKLLKAKRIQDKPLEAYQGYQEQENAE